MSASLEYSDDASARAVSDGDPSSSAPDDASPRGVSDASFEASGDISPRATWATTPALPQGPLNQCGHELMTECHQGCGHWHCPRCGLDWDDAAEGDW